MFRIRKVMAVLAASALLATGASVGAGVTHLTPTAAAQTAAVDGIPDRANLHIHKYIGLPGETRADGAEQDISDIYTPASGVTFYTYNLGIDLTTLEGWQATRDVDIDDFFTGPGANNYNSLDPDVQAGLSSGVDTDDGTAEFNDLETGVYLVVEEPNPTVDGQTLAPSAPFLVTVPMTDPVDSSTWLDNVHVYPKNQAFDEPELNVYDPEPTGDSVDLTGSSLGEQIGYQISGEVPEIGSEDSFSGFVITDRLPLELGEPTLQSVTLGGEPLADDAYNPETYRLADGAWVLRVDLADVTLAGLNAAAGSSIVVGFTAPVVDTPANTPGESSTLDNRAWILPSAPGIPAGPDWDPASPDIDAGAESNVIRSVYGEINIDKFDGADDARLEGAIFELHRCTAGAPANDSLPIQVGGTAEWTTDGAGAASISGIHLSNQGGAPAYEDLWAGNGEEFCLVETQAPDGYALLPEPLPVTLTYGPEILDFVPTNELVENFEADAGFQLPLTGGMGIWLILGAGALLLIIAALYYAFTRDRTAE